MPRLGFHHHACVKLVISDLVEYIDLAGPHLTGRIARLDNFAFFKRGYRLGGLLVTRAVCGQGVSPGLIHAIDGEGNIKTSPISDPGLCDGDRDQLGIHALIIPYIYHARSNGQCRRIGCIRLIRCCRTDAEVVVY